ncbi:MAG TPA: hypothetical protein VNJ53_06370 [Gaiellaceae bacterium]|nr:hypothetical protein [Gaiellaceae bacterium]
MDAERVHDPQDRAELEKDREAWGLPGPQPHLGGPPLREWPYREPQPVIPDVEAEPAA